MTDYQEKCQLNNTINVISKENDKNVIMQDLTNDSTMISDMSMDVSHLSQRNAYKQINKGETVNECDSEEEDVEYELSDELIKEIENKIDQQFEEKYKEMSEYYETKILELLSEQEKVFTKSEMIKAKIRTLETYLKNYCKINGIDYNELISSEK